MTERFRVVPAAYVLLRRERDGQQQVLLQLRADTGYMDGHWACAAAGHVERGEPVVDAACREAAEELGVVITPEQLDAVCVMHRTGGTGRAVDERVDFFFECRRWRGDPRVVEPHKTADMRWFPLDALPEPVVPHEHAVLDRIRKGDVPRVLIHGFTSQDSR